MSYKVLLADDEIIFLEFMSQTIDWAGQGVQLCPLAHDGEEALNFILKYRPDVVFIDINMPKMNGLEVCKKVREMGYQTKIIIMTAHDDFTFAHQAIQVGVIDYLLKPFDKDEIKSVLKQAIKSIEERKNFLNIEPSIKEIIKSLNSMSKQEKLAQKIDTYLQEHYMDSNLSVDSVAEKMLFENSYVRRIFKDQTNHTIMQRLEEIRISKAREMLSTKEEIKMIDIASACGFGDQYYFSKRFKLLCGLSPQEYQLVYLSKIEG